MGTKSCSRNRSMPRTLDWQLLLNNSVVLDCTEKWKHS